MDNVLLLGNGFSRMLFADMPSWEELFDGANSPIKNYTILYEIFFLKNGGTNEATVKENLTKEIMAKVSIAQINRNLRSLSEFGVKLKEKHIYNILTTNYDNGLDVLLCDICGYKELPKTQTDEKVYSIRTYKEYENKTLGHRVKLWKIHGEFNRIASIMYGYDQYCGALSKLSQYIKGTYKSSSKSGPVCKTKIEEKCKYNIFDGISWAELFFNSNIYIVGLGMQFAEIDLWWILNKRARIRANLSTVNNRICYLYSKNHDILDDKKDIIKALKAFGVEIDGIECDEKYIEHIFEKID